MIRQVVLQLERIRAGIEGMTYPYKEQNYAFVPCPDVVVLDLDLPKRDGHETLSKKTIRRNPKTIPGSGLDDFANRAGHLNSLRPLSELLNR